MAPLMSCLWTSGQSHAMPSPARRGAAGGSPDPDWRLGEFWAKDFAARLSLPDTVTEGK